ncbi:MAG: HEAT repeat domain-containing protein, partial [Nitrospirae bacterium]|nr:HEAT repeat domain-containing protein [Nitrospirota bacterium]
MARVVFITAFTLLLGLTSGTSWAYRDYFTSEQKEQLSKVQTVLVETIALTDKGSVDPA